MSARLRSTPWWEQCEKVESTETERVDENSLRITRRRWFAGLGHDFRDQAHPVNPQDPDGIFFVRCIYCVRAATRRRRLAQEKMVIVLDIDLGDRWLEIAEVAPSMFDAAAWRLFMDRCTLRRIDVTNID